MITLFFLIITGAGVGLGIFTSLLVTIKFFQDHLALVNAIVQCGWPFGLLVSGPFSQYLLDRYSWDVFLILAAISLVTLLGGVAYYPLDKYKDNMLRGASNAAKTEEDLLLRTKSPEGDEESSEESTPLYKNISALYFCISWVSANIHNLTLIYVPARGEAYGASPSQVALLLTYFATVDISLK